MNVGISIEYVIKARNYLIMLYNKDDNPDKEHTSLKDTIDYLNMLIDDIK